MYGNCDDENRCNLIILLILSIGILALLGISKYSFQKACLRREIRWPDLGIADDWQYEILTEAYKIKNEPNRKITITASDGVQLVGHYYERKKNAPVIIFFHGLWSNCYTNRNQGSRCQAPETINEFYKDSMNLKLVVYRSVLNFKIHTLIM